MSAVARFAVFLSIVLGVWLGQHLYVGWRLLSLPVAGEVTARRALLVLLAAGFVSYPMARILERAGVGWFASVLEYSGAVWMGVVFLLMAGFLVADVVTLGGLVLKPWVMHIRTAAATLAAVGAVLGWFAGAAAPCQLKVEAPMRGLPAALDGFKIVQISDVHLGSLKGPHWWRTVVDRVHESEPDLVVITGDLIDGDAGTVRRLLPKLVPIESPHGVLTVLGNHEFYAGAEASRGILRDAGWRVLDNEAVEIQPGLWVAGIPDDRGSRQTGNPGANLEAALAPVPDGAAVVLLQHAPEREEELATKGIGLLLNGHTHGGQIWPFTYLVRMAYPHDAGVYRVGEMTQVVSRGAGLWGPPMRLFAPADVVVVTLRSREPRPKG